MLIRHHVHHQVLLRCRYALSGNVGHLLISAECLVKLEEVEVVEDHPHVVRPVEEVVVELLGRQYLV